MGRPESYLLIHFALFYHLNFKNLQYSISFSIEHIILIRALNIIRLRRSTKATLIIKLKDGLITALKNTSNSILLTVKEIIVIT